jgi:hypothetical protein
MDGYLYFMKKLLFSAALLLLIQTAWAQKDLQVDENNRFVYYEVVDKPGVSTDTLFQRGMVFAKKAGKSTAPNSITTKGKFTVYASSLASKKDAGEISYVLTIDTKDQKYRYKFGTFIFKPYRFDRYGSMSAVPGVEIDLERMASKYGQKDTESYLTQAAEYCKATAANLKMYMDRAQIAKKADAPKKVATENW